MVSDSEGVVGGWDSDGERMGGGTLRTVSDSEGVVGGGTLRMGGGE